MFIHRGGEEPATTEVCGLKLTNWGCHSSTFAHSYLNVAGAVGMQEEEISIFCKRFDSVLTEIEKSKKIPETVAESTAAAAVSSSAKQNTDTASK